MLVLGVGSLRRGGGFRFPQAWLFVLALWFLLIKAAEEQIRLALLFVSLCRCLLTSTTFAIILPKSLIAMLAISFLGLLRRVIRFEVLVDRIRVILELTVLIWIIVYQASHATFGGS